MLIFLGRLLFCKVFIVKNWSEVELYNLKLNSKNMPVRSQSLIVRTRTMSTNETYRMRPEIVLIWGGLNSKQFHFPDQKSVVESISLK